MSRKIRPVGSKEIAQILRDIQDALAFLKRVGSGELEPMRQSLVDLEQQRLILRSSARPPEAYRPRRTVRIRVISLTANTRRYRRAAYRIEVIEIHARAEEPARRPVNHMPINIVSLKHHIPR